MSDQPQDAEPELIARIRRGESCDGREIDLSQVLEILLSADEHAHTRWRIHRASIRPFSLHQLSVPAHVEFEECTFQGDASRFQGTTFHGDLTFQECTVPGQLTFESCTIEGKLAFNRLRGSHLPGAAISIYKSTVQDQVKFDCCEFLGIPNIERSRFLGGLSYVSLEPSQLAACPYFNRVRFDADVAIQVPRSRPSLEFHHCDFSNQCELELSLPSIETALDFTGSVIDGRVAGQPQDGFVVAPVTLELKGVEVKGYFDCRRFQPRWLNLEDAILRSGTVLLDRTAFPRRLAAGDWIRLRVQLEDRNGILLREQFATDPSAFSGVVDPSWQTNLQADNLIQVSREYEELYHAFSSAPESDWQEDYCLYKFMEFRRRHQRSIAGRQYTLLSFVVFLLCSSLVGWLVACPNDVVGGYLTLLLCSLMVPLPFRRYAAAQGALWSFIVSCSILGHGVIVRRVLVAAAVMIGLFAVVYGASSQLQPTIGRIVHQPGGQDIGILDVPDECACCGNARDSFKNYCRRLLYFSTVTFTTLGYGEYRPEGRMQYVAAAEAICGSITMAILTVIFARRFLRF